MSRTELDRLLEDAREQPALLAELQSKLPDPTFALRWAREKGYLLGTDEIAELRDSQRELSDDELDQVAGGDWAPPSPPNSTTGSGG